MTEGVPKSAHACLWVEGTPLMKFGKERADKEKREAVRIGSARAQPADLGTHGGSWWPKGRFRAMSVIPSVTDASCHRKSWQVLVWVVMSLLPLVAGGRSGFRTESEVAVGFIGTGVEEPPLETLPDIEEDIDEGSDSPWQGLFEPSVFVEDDQQPARWERSRRSPVTTDIQTKGARKKKKKKEKEEKKKKDKNNGRRHSSRECRVEKREMRVRDLGMGFDSDEIVLFKFCVGSCQRSRGNYDLALRALLANGSLPKRTARKISAHPCCRPTAYEPVSFMDATTTWRTIKSLSAADCECVG
ncbi:glial cell line-derived neurotrophic factor [Triplophysa rosa]|uniref:glial cell line-derived neurotrophic factor n=1 Tax=Triplophysa rosa TaxID=992332 RepID=UPI002545C8D1|nr:glial cell line-derived neurotrophic factor [Triplophysa rosa]